MSSTGSDPDRDALARGPLDEAAAWERVVLRPKTVAGPSSCAPGRGFGPGGGPIATEEFERLAKGPLTGLRLGLLHGQMPAADKEAAMSAFRSGETQVLVATTVVEVGVDVRRPP